jgi:hypothetical protein
MKWIALLILLLILPIFISSVSAQRQPNYYVTVKPTTSDSPLYTTAGRNWTVTFEALWTYGSDNGAPVQNATVLIEVSNNQSKVVAELEVKSDGVGVISFNYSSPTANILTFTPIKLTSQDGREWSEDIVDSVNNVYGLQSESVVVWWDTFHVSLVSSDTSMLGRATVTVKVTYLLLPDKGLTLPEWATYSNQTFLSKYVQNASVIVNGVKAQESQELGVYSASIPIWLPTTYVNVVVSQEGWVTVDRGFGFLHQENQTVWIYAVAFGSVFAVGLLLVACFVFRKADNPLLFKRKNFHFYGATLLAVASMISLYWGLVGLDSSLHGFDWLLLAIVGVFSFVFGLLGSVLSLRKKSLALVTCTIIPSMLTNTVIIQSSLYAYQLACPWIMLFLSILLSMLAGVLICQAEQ